MKIKIIYIILLLLTFPFYCYAQTNELNLKLKWVSGEKKRITIKSNVKVYKNGELIQDTLILQKEELTVARETESAYFVDHRIENDLLKFGAKYDKNIQAELPNNLFVDLKYRIDKATLKAELINLHEVDSFFQKSNDLIMQTIEKKFPEQIVQAKDQFEKFFKSYKENLSSVQDEFYSSLLYPINKKFVIGETLTTTDTLDNPFELQKFAGAKVTACISKAGNLKNTFDITVDKTYDIEAYKSMMEVMSDKMKGVSQQALSGSNKIVDPLVERMTTMFKTMHLEASGSMVISQKLDASWPSKIITRAILKMKDANNETSAIIDTTIDIK